MAVSLFALCVAHLALRHHFTIFNFDDWEVLERQLAGGPSRWLFTPLHGHIMPAALWLFHVDSVYLGGEGHLLVWVSLLCAGASALFLFWGFHAGGEEPTALSRIVFGWTSFALFWAGALFSFFWGLTTVYVIGTMWLFAAVACFAVWAATGGQRSPLAWFGALAAFFSTFTVGAGYGAWLALLSVAIAARMPARRIGTLALGAAGCLGLYVLLLAASRDPNLDWVSHAADQTTAALLGFATGLIGSLPSRVARGLVGFDLATAYGVSVAGGGAGLAWFVLHALRLWRRPPASPRDLLALGLMTAALFSAGTTAVFRAHLGVEQSIYGRFLMWSTVFWIGAACALPRRLAAAARRTRAAAAVCVVVLTVCMLPAVDRAFRDHVLRQRRLSEASLSLLLGIRSETYAREFVIWRSPEVIFAVADRLEREPRGFFRDPRREIAGTPLGELGTLVGAHRCRGSVGQIHTVATKGSPALRFGGRVWDTAGSHAPRSILVTDSSGRVRGLGNLLASWWGPEAGFAESRLRGAPWSGVVANFVPRGEYAVYAVLANGRLCRFQSFEAPRLESPSVTPPRSGNHFMRPLRAAEQG